MKDTAKQYGVFNRILSPGILKEASACGMQQLITNSESPFSLTLLSLFFLVAFLSSMMACFVVAVLWKGAQKKRSQRVH